jgi:hypothetical protein
VINVTSDRCAFFKQLIFCDTPGVADASLSQDCACGLLVTCVNATSRYSF